MQCPRCGSEEILVYSERNWHLCLMCQLRYADQPRDPNGEFGTGKEAGDATPTEATPPPTDASASPDPALMTPLETGHAPDAEEFAKAIAQNPKGGFTINLKDGTSPTKGFVVAGLATAIHIDTSDPVKAGQEIADFAAKHPEATHIGGWFDPKTGIYEVEPSQLIDTMPEAVEKGEDRNQKSIYDVTNDTYIQTYGTGVFGHKNDNYVSPSVGSPVHPGSKPTGYAYSGVSVVGTTIPINMGASSMSGLSNGAQDRINKKAKDVAGLDLPTITGNILKAMEHANGQQFADGLAAYARYNAVAENISHDTGITAEQASGMIAATSRQTALGSNLAGAANIAKMVANDQIINLPQSVIDACALPIGKDGKAQKPVHIKNGPLSEAGDIDAQARAIMRTISLDPSATVDPIWGSNLDGSPSKIMLSCGDDGVGDAIRMARDPKAIDTFLGGMKQRSFYNNIADPNDPRFVTLDGFMYGLAMGVTGDEGEAYAATAEKTGMQLSTTPKITAENTAGCYPLVADGVREATKQFNAAHGTNLSPAQGQAVAWVAGGGGKPKGVPGTPTPIARPADSAANAASASPFAVQKPQSAKEIIQPEYPTIANSVAAYTPTVVRDLVPETDAQDAVRAFNPNVPDEAAPAGMVQGVKTKDGKILTAIMSQETYTTMTSDAEAKSIVEHAMPIILSRAADLYDHDNLGLNHPPVVLIETPLEFTLRDHIKIDDALGIRGETSPEEPGIIHMNAVYLNVPNDASDNYAMPVGNVTGIDAGNEYTVTHEYGHLTSFAHDMYPKGVEHTPETAHENFNAPMGPMKTAFMSAQKVAANLPPDQGLSEYGKSNPHEAYAECFAEWTLTGGKTTNPIARTYADRFHWDKPEKLEPGSQDFAHPIPDLGGEGHEDDHD